MKLKEGIKPNFAQMAAIEAIEGAIMLLAGPGTGKTFTLIRRVENMIEKGIDPSSILCLTFSEAAASEMKTRLVTKLGGKAANVNVSTYHSFCMEIIRQNPSDFDMAKEAQVADDVTRQTIIKESIDEVEEINFLKDRWGNKYFYIPQIPSAIETIKRERTTKEEYFDFLKNSPDWELKLGELNLELKEKEKLNKGTITLKNNIANLENKIGKAKEFYLVYEIYKRKMNENGLLDFSDMINLVLEKMESDDEFLYRVSKDYKYILVDEYQDTSKVQNDLIFNILKGAKTENIFVVGDDDQIIYSFQGARSRNLNDFLEKFPNAKIICLTENRRSTQTILDFAQEIIKYDKFRLGNTLGADKTLVAKDEEIISKEQKIKFNIFTETVQEKNNIVEEIEKLIQGGVKPSEIAILARKNDRLEDYARLLKQKNIPYILQKQKDAFCVPSFIQIYFYLKLLVNSYLEQDKLFALLSSEPFKVQDKIIADILVQKKKTGKSVVEIIEEIENSPEIDKFNKTFRELKEKKSFTPTVPLLYEIITKTGILDYYSNKSDKKIENINAIKRLIDEGNSYTTLHKNARLNEFVSHLSAYFEKEIKLELPKSIYKTEAVQLLTYHGSKGREFEYVFMPNLTAKAFEKSSGGNQSLELPIKKSVFSEDKTLNLEAELLRILFVGITRAKFGLNLSYANTNNGAPQIASSYITRALDKTSPLLEQKIFSLTEEEKLDETIKSLQNNFLENEIKDEIQTRAENFTLSQTSLNKYISCPLNFFYSEILSVPVYVEDKDILEYGSSIHKAIDHMTKEAIKSGYFGKKEDMKQKFLEEMDERIFTTFEKKEELKQRGINSIEKNFEKFIECDPKNILSTEYRMELNFEGTLLKGFADRISKDSQGNIYIYDFKTGGYKSVKANINYYNQLRFYKFLYESINPDKKVAQTSLVFFEEGCKESFPEADLTCNEEIKDKIKEAIKGIKSLNFEPKEDKNTCKNCAYKLICRLFKQED